MAYPEADFVSFNEHNGEARLEEYAESMKEKEVVYVSDAGMPVISDPGQLLVAYCQEHALVYDVLPGASAVTTAYAARLNSQQFRAWLIEKGLSQVS